MRGFRVLAVATVATVAVTTLLVAAGGSTASVPDGSRPGHAAGAAGAGARPGSRAVALLPPDMYSLRARDVQIRRSGGVRTLRFAAMLADAGPGPLELRPRPQGDCPPGQRLARQRVHVDRNRDGRYQRRTDTAVRSRRVGCMLDHPTHHHWHFDAMAAYRLVDVTPRRRVVAARPKVSFCLRDNQPIPGTRPRLRRSYFGACGRNVMQGISPGWVDLYDADTPGQSLRLPRRLPDGVYCLVLRADPRDQLLEADEDNNARARAVRIRGDRVGTPRVRTCRNVAR